jgi:hypothetical protein
MMAQFCRANYSQLFEMKLEWRTPNLEHAVPRVPWDVQWYEFSARIRLLPLAGGNNIIASRCGIMASSCGAIDE